jgi:hypothetical protein
MKPLNVNVLIKYLSSFFKSDWQLKDYPLRFICQKNQDAFGRFKPIPWTVQIVNWPAMNGYGDTKAEAYNRLVENFNNRKESGLKIARPGTGLPIEFASTANIDNYEEVAAQFLRQILSMDYKNCWISDESSLWDFHGEETNDHLHRKIYEIYGINVSDIDDGKLVKIFERIKNGQ